MHSVHGKMLLLHGALGLFIVFICAEAEAQLSDLTETELERLTVYYPQWGSVGEDVRPPLRDRIPKGEPLNAIPDDTTYFFPIDGLQVAEPTGVSGSGCGVVTYNAAERMFSVFIDHDLGPLTGAGIYFGPRGVRGTLRFALDPAQQPIASIQDNINEEDIRNFFSGNLYVLLSTQAFPAGAIRGQIVDSVCGDLTDLNADGQVNAVDVQLIINAVLGLDGSEMYVDVNGDAVVDAVDVQIIINVALGL